MGTSEYYPDLKNFDLAKLKDQLKTTRLLPSQQILRDKIDERFTCIEKNGIENLEQLQNVLKTKSAVQLFAMKTGIPVDYLTVLRREVNMYQPKPINLKDFPGFDPDVIEKLQQIGIKNTEQLFPHVLTPQDRNEFAKQHRIDDDVILELTKLTDVARTKWVGPKFARLLIQSKYDTLEKVANSDHEKLYHALVRTNEMTGIYKGKFGKDDMKLWVASVQDVPLAIQY